FIKTINECKDDNNCIISSYKARIKELSLSLENSKSFPDGLIEYIKTIQENPTKCNKDKCTTIDYENISTNNFWQDFFRYKDLKFKPKIVDDKDYSSQEVKDTLKYCWDLGLNRRVLKSIEPNYVIYYFLEINRFGAPYSSNKIKDYKDIKIHKYVTINEVVLDDKNYLTLSGGFGDMLFIEKDFCNHPIKNKDLLKLLYESNSIKLSTDFKIIGRNVFVVNYKDRDYILNYYYIFKSYIIGIDSVEDMVSNIYYYPYKGAELKYLLHEMK
ncbi:lysozyme inhibitor LprI family protein, partial [Campylobacter canadensis]